MEAGPEIGPTQRLRVVSLKTPRPAILNFAQMSKRKIRPLPERCPFQRGYLVPFWDEIVAANKAGLSDREIAEQFRRGSGMVGMLSHARTRASRPPDFDKLRRRVAWAERELEKAKTALAAALGRKG